MQKQLNISPHPTLFEIYIYSFIHKIVVFWNICVDFIVKHMKKHFHEMHIHISPCKTSLGCNCNRHLCVFYSRCCVAYSVSSPVHSCTNFVTKRYAEHIGNFRNLFLLFFHAFLLVEIVKLHSKMVFTSM